MSSNELFIPTYNRFTDRQFDPSDPIGQQIIDMIMAPYFVSGIYAELTVLYDDVVLIPIKAAFESAGRACNITDAVVEVGAAKKIAVVDMA